MPAGELAGEDTVGADKRVSAIEEALSVFGRDPTDTLASAYLEAACYGGTRPASPRTSLGGCV